MIARLDHWMHCTACGPSGRFRRRRARHAQAVAEAGLVAFFTRLRADMAGDR